MGEEKKEAEEKKNNGAEGKEEKKELEGKKGGEGENKEEEKPQEIVIKVDMHCEACARKVAKSLKGFEGVEDVTVDCKANKVVVKGKMADPVKVCKRIKKKTGRKVELISGLPPKLPEDQNKDAPEPKQEEKKQEPPEVVTVVLKMGMYCEACAQFLQKKIRKIPGIESATADLSKEQVTVKGRVDPAQLVNEVYKRTKKQASIVKDEEKKNEEKKDEDKKDEKKDEKKDGTEGAKGDDDDTKLDIKKTEYYLPKYDMECAYHSQCFSDENPNACSVM